MTAGCSPNTTSTSPGSTLWPRILTWQSARPKYVQLAVGALTHPIARAIEPCARLIRERMRDEPFGRLIRAPCITSRQAGATHVKLADGAGRHRLKIRIKNKALDVRNGPSDRDRPGSRALVGGGIDRALRRAVEVDERGRNAAAKPVPCFRPQRLSSAVDKAKRRTRGPGRLLDEEFLQDRGDDHQHGDPVASSPPRPAPAGSCSPSRLQHDQARSRDQRLPKFKHRCVKADRRFLQHSIGFAQRKRPLQPEHVAILTRAEWGTATPLRPARSSPTWKMRT